MTLTDLILMLGLVAANVFGIGIGMAIGREQKRRRAVRTILPGNCFPLSDAWENYTPTKSYQSK